jgi:ABC-type multidrug transport system fused ATPase/permease subunit
MPSKQLGWGVLDRVSEEIPSDMLSWTAKINLYFAAGAIMILVFSLATASARASSILHKDLLQRVVRCPMSFFDSTPMGRILNRFTADMDAVDNPLVWVCQAQLPIQLVHTILLDFLIWFRDFIYLSMSINSLPQIALGLAAGYVVMKIFHQSFSSCE